jgi:hypothetical protein
MQDALDLAFTSRVFLEAYRKAFIPRIRFDYQCRHPDELFWLQKWVDDGKIPPHRTKDDRADIYVDMDAGDDECGKLESRFEHVRDG